MRFKGKGNKKRRHIKVFREGQEKVKFKGTEEKKEILVGHQEGTRKEGEVQGKEREQGKMLQSVF